MNNKMFYLIGKRREGLPAMLTIILMIDIDARLIQKLKNFRLL